MQTIKDLWNWRPAPEVAKTVQAKALRLMAGFLALMVCCTIISRAADSITVPIVSTESPRKMALTKSFSTDGTVEAHGGTPVMATGSLPVLTLPVSQGQMVNAGDLLFTCDTSSIQKEITGYEIDKQSLLLQLEAMDKNEELDDEQLQIKLERALEDLEKARNRASFTVQEAAIELRQSREAYRNYRDKDSQNYDADEEERLLAAYRRAQLAYDNALEDRDNAIIEAERTIQDLQNQSVDVSRLLKEIELQKLEITLSELRQSLANGGAVYAPVGGVLTKLEVQLGGMTPSTASAIITSVDTLQIRTQITREQKKLVEAGDLTTFTPYGEKKISDVPILSIQASEENAEVYDVVLQLPEGAATPGTVGELDFSNRSETYETCIPLNALYGTDNDYYILTVREMQTTLGTEYVAEKMSVTLQERNDEYAAISGGIWRDTKVITGGDRAVREGDRIRLQDAG